MNNVTRTLSSIDSELNILNILLEVNEDYTSLTRLNHRDRAIREVKDRILNGLYKNKHVIEGVKMELIRIIYSFFEKNPQYPRCPFNEYSGILQSTGMKASMFFEMVVRNDGAINRWLKKSDEWEDFTPERVKNKIKHLQDMRKRREEQIKKKKDGSDVGVFDGGLF